jgi:4-diphosphocytidyl-2C-methyl-D-erythritol kinase
MHLLAPAKINLHLRVGRRRGDGFHPLLSWMCTVGLFDSLTLEADAGLVRAAPPGESQELGAPGPGGGAGSFAHVAEGSGAESLVALDICGDGDRPDLPRDGRNLVVRIAAAFVRELRRGRDAARHGAGPAATPPMWPAFRAEGALMDPSSGAARAAARAGEGSAASAGAAPMAPGMVREDPCGRPEGVRVGSDAGVAGSHGDGAGAVRGAEGSGRSNRRAGAEGDAGGTSTGGGGFAEGGFAEGGSAAAGAPVRVVLDKHIPVGAGLGGGSSDGATVLVALDRLLSAGWAAERLSGFAARFGSDVPFFVHAALGSASCACRGRGEVVVPVARPAARWAVIVSPPFALSTQEVYERFDAMGLGFDEALEPGEEPEWGAWAGLPARELMARLVNDLEPAAFSVRPELARLREKVEGVAGRAVRMSGSGSSLFTLYDVGEEEVVRELSAGGVRVERVEVAPG